VTDPRRRNDGAVERRAWILTTLHTLGFLSVTDLARRFGVSQMTVRRDLHALEGTGSVRLVHGGAVLIDRAQPGPALPDDGRTAARQRVAEHAAAMVGAGDTIAIDAGPIGSALAQALPEDFAGCVVTNSMPVLAVLTAGRLERVVALGGELLRGRQAFVGPTAEAAVAGLRLRTFFLAPEAIDARGIYGRSPAETSLQQRLMDIADEVVGLVTHEQFAASAPARVGPLDRLATLVADRRPAGELACALRHAGVTTRVAGAGADR
jgi:DeoR family transcriptional regulator of aga operon